MTQISMELVHSGKVRDLYAVPGNRLLMVASDRLSAFDVVMAEPIPNKGRVLTAMTAFWLEEVKDVVPNSVISFDPAEIDELTQQTLPKATHGRTMLVERAEMVSLECIVRGYLAGQAFTEYERQGTIHDMPAPMGLRLADRLPEPMFTPSTKAEEGHDLNISIDAARDLAGRALVDELAAISVAVYQRAAARAESVGFVLADTKFEFGHVDGRLVLCDEVCTPDSSRLWPSSGIVPGSTPPAYDKQPFRDWLEGIGWDKQPPPPKVPEDIVELTSDRYVAAYELVTGRSLSDWYGAEA
ncbi:MAG: phosphoribosylaminoimidazolesuccinocarboxamide synthase [Actinomycetota bacterium]